MEDTSHFNTGIGVSDLFKRKNGQCLTFILMNDLHKLPPPLPYWLILNSHLFCQNPNQG